MALNVAGARGALEIRLPLLEQAVARRADSAPLKYELAEAFAAVGRGLEAVHVYRQALAIQRPNLFPSLSLARVLVSEGVISSDVLAGLAVGEAAAGREAETRRLIDFDRFFRCRHLDVPAPFTNEAFYPSLVSEIKSELTFYDKSASHATRQSWRNDKILKSEHPAWVALIRQVADEIRCYIDALPTDHTHPFLATRPSPFCLMGWALVSQSTSYVEPHYHHTAWATAVYYVATPAATLEDSSRDGWLHVGPPGPMGPLVGWDDRFVAPSPGTLVIMPGYFFHSTRPTGLDEERVCIVFDIATVPDEDAS
jgi:hypothetical protein